MIIGNKIHIGSRRKVINGTRLNLSPEVKAYISGLTTRLSSEQVTKLDTFVKALKTGLGISALSEAFDVMYVLGGETAESSLKNLVKNAHHGTAVNSPAFTQFEGFAGNGTSSRIDTNYIPSTNNIRYTLNSASVGIYCISGAAGNYVDMGCRSADNNKRLELSIYYNGLSFYRINQNVTGETDRFANSNIHAMYLYNRSANNAMQAYKNKIKLKDGTAETTELPDVNIPILCGKVGTNYELYSNRKYSFVFLGRSFNQAECNVITDAIEAYMDSNGKGVIS